MVDSANTQPCSVAWYALAGRELSFNHADLKENARGETGAFEAHDFGEVGGGWLDG
jgi:hypothetical protein